MQLFYYIIIIIIAMKYIFSSAKENIPSLFLLDAPSNEFASITDVGRSNTYKYRR